MPFGYSGSGYREPAPKRLTLEELLEQLAKQNYTPPPRPSEATSLRDLDEDDRKRAQKESLWAGLAAMGALVNGDQRRAAGGVDDIRNVQQGAISGANARRMKAWEAENLAGMAEHEKRRGMEQGAALFGMYQEVAEGESPAFAAKAEAAARAGSMSELEKMREQKPQRAAARAKGYDPDAWGTTKRLQDELEAELKRAADAAALPGKEAEKRSLGGIETEQEIAKQEELRKRRLGTYKPPEYEPLERVRQRAEIQAEVAAKHGGGGIKGRLGQAPGGQWGWISPPSPENPAGKFTPIDGQPKAQGSAHIFTVNGIPYAIDRNNPDAGARELPIQDLGAAPPVAPQAAPPKAAPKKEKLPAGAAAATKRLDGIKDAGVRQRIAKARAAGYSDSEIAAFLGLQ